MAVDRLTVTHEATFEELQAHMADNAAYRTRRDTVMAENFIDAAEALLAIPLSEYDHSGERARVEVRIIQERLDAAIQWLETERACSATPRQFIPARDWNW